MPFLVKSNYCNYSYFMFMITTGKTQGNQTSVGHMERKHFSPVLSDSRRVFFLLVLEARSGSTQGLHLRDTQNTLVITAFSGLGESQMCQRLSLSQSYKVNVLPILISLHPYFHFYFVWLSIVLRVYSKQSSLLPGSSIQRRQISYPCTMSLIP